MKRKQSNHKVLPQPRKVEAGALNNAMWRHVSSAKEKYVQTTAALTVLDISRDGMAASEAPVDVASRLPTPCGCRRNRRRFCSQLS